MEWFRAIDPSPPGEFPRTMQSFLLSAAVLAAFVAVGVIVIVTIRKRFREAEPDHGAWETTLAGYRNLRDKGVLTAEEYRKIKTLVEPRVDPEAHRSSPGADDGHAPNVRRVG